jgi:hypothetical protein
MKQLILRTFAGGAILASGIIAQPRQAVMTGGQGDRGKCTIEVVVDGSAQVEVRGNSATLRTIAGQPAQWRRFECNAPMPPNPVNFRFAGVDGRGRQQLVRDPRQGGVAVVQIDDPEGGTEGYTFDLMWDAGNSGGPGYSPGYQQDDRRGGDQRPPAGYQDRPRGGDASGYGGYPDRGGDGQYRPNYRDSDYYQRYGHGFSTEEAVRTCQDAVAQQATRRFGTSDVHFHGTRIDDRPGRNDWVMGTLDVHRGRREERFGFACSVNFDTGRVRSADIDPRPLPDNDRWH